MTSPNEPDRHWGPRLTFFGAIGILGFAAVAVLVIAAMSAWWWGRDKMGRLLKGART